MKWAALGENATRLRLAIVCGLASLLGAGEGRAQKIGVFFDPNGTTCNGTFHAGHPGTLWILAVAEGAAIEGITGAEFQLTGFPSSWFPSASPAGIVSTGSPLSGGADMAFSTCVTGTNRIVVLYTVNFFVTTEVGPTTLSVTASQFPSNAEFRCPLVMLCDRAPLCGSLPAVPKFTKVCAQGLSATINGSPCTVDALPAATLFRLLPVWPNPTRGEASVQFELSRGDEVQLQVYDLAGRLVRELVRGPAEKGHHLIPWDGRDQTGRAVSSGIYFVQLTSEGVSARNRLAVLR